MNQYLIAFCYLFIVILLFLAFFICRAVPASQPINIDLYRNNTIISFAISDPSQIAYTVLEEQHEVNNDNWGNQEAWENEDGWNHTDDWNKQETQPQLHTAEWIDWVFDHVNINQIREITGRLFTQNFRNQFEEANRFHFHADTLHPSILELEESTIEKEQQDQWEINTNDKIPGLGNFKSRVNFFLV